MRPEATSFGDSNRETTGRVLVTFAHANEAAAATFISDAANMSMARTSDFVNSSVQGLDEDAALYFDALGVAVLPADPDQQASIMSASGASPATLMVEPERFCYALGLRPSDDYLRGYHDAIGMVLEGGGAPLIGAEAFADNDFTWGLNATKAATSSKTGRGIKVAVLDTGIHTTHPDFAGRVVTTKSFVTGEMPNPDIQGHGTHCCGTICGPRNVTGGLGYGCAPDVDLFVGKVLNNQGRGRDGDILSGIDWAVRSGVNIISMSLGAPVSEPGFSLAYETAASRALLSPQGTLIVAAAGNESQRPGSIKPVGSPANCPSVMAVGAVDESTGIAFFSCGGLFPPSGGVDIVGPGVGVYSSFPNPNFRKLSGTSMATPHVAGIAALWAEATGQRGRMLWNMLLKNAKGIGTPSSDFGSGLVQAPA